MDNVIIKELYRNQEKYCGTDIKVSGWVRAVWDSKTFGFIEINDGSFFKNLQIVFENNLENFDEICKLTLSSSITVEGELIKTENAKQPFEVKAKEVEIIAVSAPEYPLQKKRHTMEYLRTISHLRPRTNTFMLYLEYVQLLLMQFTNFSKKTTLYMFIHQ